MPTSRTSSTKKRSRSTPWERPAPAKVARKRPTKLTPAQKAHAKARARKAGRSYPNLVDNMREASSTKKTATKKSAAKKKSGGRTSTTRKKATGSPAATKRKSTSRRAPKRTGTKKAVKRSATRRTATKRAGSGRARTSATRDPHGGLTAAGRAEFARKDGAHLKPGVTKREADMSSDEMRRKGSWAVRFYGREGTLPPLRDAQGQPTRFALTAAAWGEPVPKTVAAARAIAAKGRRLLTRAERARG